MAIGKLRAASGRHKAMKKLTVSFILASMLCFAQSVTNSIKVPGYTITAVAAPSIGAYAPTAITFDSAGNMYVAELNLGVILKLSAAGVFSAFAGGGNALFYGDGGPATAATIDPAGLATDSAGNLYIADASHNRVRKVNTSGIISTIAGPGTGTLNGPPGDGGPATSATLYEPVAVAVDAVGDIFVAEPAENRIRKISPTGTITTFVTLPSPSAIATDSAGNLYVAESLGTSIVEVSPNGSVTTLAGTGIAAFYGDGGLATSAGISGYSLTGSVGGIAVDSTGNIYITDVDADRVRVITSDGNINTIAGGGTALFNPASGPIPATSVKMAAVYGLAVAGNGTIYVTGLSYNYYLCVLASSSPVLPLPSILTKNSASAFLTSPGVISSSVALGGWMEIYGSYLAPDARSWAGSDFGGINAPTSLDGTSVSIGGQSAFVSYISAAQVNVQVPSSIGTGAQPLVITNSNGHSATYSVTVNPEQPALLSTPAFKIGAYQYAVALFTDGVTYVLPTGAIAGVPSRPAKEGDTITLYGIGFGATAPSLPAGQIVQASNSLVLPLAVTVNSNPATVTYAGLAPGIVGLYQFNIVVPSVPVSPSASVVTFNLGSAGRAALYLATQ
jgi:uncharacterized protein (TIGR03437 family)